MKKIIAIILIVGGLALIISAFYGKKDTAQGILGEENISSASLERNLDVSRFHFLMKTRDFTIIDVRTPEEIAEGKIIEDALEIDFYDDDFQEQLAALDPNEKYLIYCRSGNRSGKTLTILDELGFTSTQHLEGGINAWRGEVE